MRKAKKKESTNHGGARPNSGPKPKLTALKQAGYAVNTILLPEQRDWLTAFALARGIKLSQAFRAVIAEAMARTPARR